MLATQTPFPVWAWESVSSHGELKLVLHSFELSWLKLRLITLILSSFLVLSLWPLRRSPFDFEFDSLYLFGLYHRRVNHLPAFWWRSGILAKSITEIKDSEGGPWVLGSPSYYFSFLFWLCWVFIAVCGLSLVVVSRGYSSLWCLGLSLWWLLLLQSMGYRRTGFSSCGTRAQ